MDIKEMSDKFLKLLTDQKEGVRKKRLKRETIYAKYS